MRWTVIDKSKTTPEKELNHYKKYKEDLRNEANCKCVYCAIHESSLGGIDHFHVEHYKPKSDSRFAHLIHKYENLYYSCPICNRFKSNDWPNEPVHDHSISSYPNPNGINYNDLFEVDDNGMLDSVLIAPKYIMQKLFLNRPQLINERKHYIIENKLSNIIEILENLKKQYRKRTSDPKLYELICKVDDIKTDILKLKNDSRTIPAYEQEEIRKLK